MFFIVKISVWYEIRKCCHMRIFRGLIIVFLFHIVTELLSLILFFCYMSLILFCSVHINVVADIDNILKVRREILIALISIYLF